MRIEEYFQQFDATLALFPHAALKTMRYDQRSETKGFIRGVILFDDGSELHVREFVDVTSGIERFKYSYHYISLPYTFFLLNGDMELYRNRHLFIEKMFSKPKT